MNLENHEKRIAQLEENLAATSSLLGVLASNDKTTQQVILSVLQLTQEQFESVITLYRFFGKKMPFDDEAMRQKFMDAVASMETKHDLARAQVAGLFAQSLNDSPSGQAVNSENP